MAYDYEYDMSSVGGPRHSEFFHGTNRDVSGKTLVPRGQRGVKGTDWGYEGGVNLNNHSSSGVFSTPSEARAWEWASTKSAHDGDQVGRARVHKVGLPKNSTRKGEVTRDEYVSSTARIQETHDIMPGRQGTFPHLNWNQFRKPGSYRDTNHPHDSDLEPKSKADTNTSLETLTGDYDDHRGQGRLF